MRRALVVVAAAVLAASPAFAQSGTYGGHYGGARPGDEALTCPQLQAEYDAAISEAAMYAGDGGSEGGDSSGGADGGGGGMSLGGMSSMAAGAMGAMGSMGGGAMGGMGGMGGGGMGAAMQGMSMGMGGGGGGGVIPDAGPSGSNGDEGGMSGGGGYAPRGVMRRPDRIRALARNKNCGLIQRAPGWERRVPPPIAASAPLDTSPEAMDGGELPDSEGGPAPDSAPEASRD
ncbi:MAG: hypothetical protein NW203_06945 [Hyphomonadaceae bacterium]|nr:hypothetical protein [Hyphomonadaceae bacterium]